MYDPSAQRLELDDALYPDVLNGIITATIRIGKRPIELGPLAFTATRAGYLPVMVFVSSVIETTLIGIADIHAQRAGWINHDTAVAVLQTIYPEAKMDTPMTVILFERAM